MKNLFLSLCALLLLSACGETSNQQVDANFKDIFTEANNRNIDLIYDTYSETLESEDDGEDDFETQSAKTSNKTSNKTSRWRLANLKTILALGLKGEIGSLAWGGSKSVELIWRRKSVSPQSLSPERPAHAELQFDEFTTDQEIDSQIAPIVNSLVQTKRVEDPVELRANLRRVTADFLEMSRALSTHPKLEWDPYKLRLDINVGVSGKVASGIFIKAGFDTRVRLEWKKNPAALYLAANDLTDNPILERVREMITAMAVDLSAAVENHTEIRNFRAKVFRIGIGIGAKAKVGAYTGKTEIIPYVYYRRRSTQSVPNLGFHYDLAQMDTLVAIRAQSEDQVLEINRKRLRKGLKKAFKFGYKMGSKLNKKKYNKRKWEVGTMKVGYKFSLNGDVGTVNVKATPNFEIEYEKL